MYVLGCFSANIGLALLLYAQFCGTIITIEFPKSKWWNKLWLECGSTLVSAFDYLKVVHLKIRNHWCNCIFITKSMQLRISHIYREGNCCADMLASYGGSRMGIIWWDLIPNFIRDDFSHKRLRST